MGIELLKKVDIVIPIYNAFESVKLCMESIKKHTDFTLHRVILINDCSSDERIKPYLDALGEEGFIIIHNEKNQGFSANVNIGMSYSNTRDVILLNSDTIVTKRWVEKLIVCAYATKETGTVTPLSNSATLASVPVAFVDNELPKGFSIDEFAQLVEQSSFCDYPTVTVAVGFCMYIKREVIEKIGFFDAETFQKGYGEENDFCSRAQIYGYQHVLCDNTFIYHEGTQSFLTTEKEKLMKEHSKILEERYPKQMRENDIFCAQNPQQYIRDNIKLHLALKNGKKNILYVSHYHFEEGAQNNCGGTQFHVKDLKEALKQEQNIFVVARDKQELLLVAYIGEEKYTFRFDIGNTSSFFLFTNQKLKRIFSVILNACKIDVVHIQNVIGLSFDIFDVAKELKLPLVITLHDYYFICPNYTLLNEKKELCNGICTSCEGRTMCLYRSIKVSKAETYLLEWRKECGRVLELCDCIFVPSESAKKMYTNIYPYMQSKMYVIEHGLDEQKDTRETLYVASKQTKSVKYSIDNFFNTAWYSDMVSGWAFLEGYDNTKTNIYVDILQRNGKKKRYKTVKSERAEVDTAFHGVGDYVNTGFSVGIHPWEVSEEVQLEMVVEQEGEFYSDGTICSHTVPKKLMKRKKNIAFLGGMNFDKGSKKAYELILADKEEVYNWYILGQIDPLDSLYHLKKENVKKVGVYDRGEIRDLLVEYNIDLVCIFSVVSETFCYTLSEAYSNQVPILGMDVGAVGERIRKLQCGWLVSPNMTGMELFQTMDGLLENQKEYMQMKQNMTLQKHKSVSQMVAEYKEYYERLYDGKIKYQTYDAKAFYDAYEENRKKGNLEKNDKKKIEELQQRLNQIEGSFWYKVTKNLHRIEFPGKKKVREWVYGVVRRKKRF